MKNKQQNKKLELILKYCKKYKWYFIIASIVILLSNLFVIVTGYLNGAAVEAVTKGEIKQSILFLVIYFILSNVVELTTRYGYYILSKVQILISRTMGFDLYKKVLALPAYAFEELSSGEIINRVSYDTETIVGSFNSLLTVAASIISSVILLIYIFFTSWIVGLEIVLFLFFYSFIVKHYSKIFKECNEESKKQNDKFSSITSETIRGIREVKTLGIGEHLVKNVKDIVTRLFETSVKEQKTGRDYDMVSVVMKIMLECSCFITCAYLVYTGDITVTFFVAMTYYIYRFAWVIENVKSFSSTYERLNVSLGRIVELLFNIKYEDVPYGDICLDEVKGVLEFKDVTFNYKNEDTLLKNFSITFEPNKKIAIVGSSGEGKSTLFNLITRIFDPVSGNIYLDGEDIRELTEISLRNSISIIRQEPFIFNRTIRENFELVKEDVSLEQIRKYCKMASIDDYIMNLPKQYDTLLGEGGVNLSGGQKQRIAIARTLMRKSKVVLFDEATSALDNESQESIKKSINELVKDHTVIIVAHRLSTIIDADIIYVIKSGKVLQSGTHDELMKNCAFYKKLYTTEGKTV